MDIGSSENGNAHSRLAIVFRLVALIRFAAAPVLRVASVVAAVVEKVTVGQNSS